MATEIEPELAKLSEEEVEKTGKKIPVFTVLKNNSILKNIFLIDSPPSPSNSPAANSANWEEVLVVGRHPDCNIILEHPSISRFHLRIHSVPALQTLSVFDLSSVHGTWVSGKKVEPGVQVELHEGDTLQFGGSTRVYRLHWVPLSHAFDMKNPFVPPLGESKRVQERQGQSDTHLDDDGLHLQDNETVSTDDYFEGLEFLFSDMNVMSPMRQLTLSSPQMDEDAKSPSHSEGNAENKFLCRGTLQLSEIAEMLPVWKPDAEKTDLDWVTSSSTYGMKSPLVPELDKPELVEEKLQDVHTALDQYGLSLRYDQIEKPSDCYAGLDFLFDDMTSPKKQLHLQANEIESPDAYFEGLNLLFHDMNMISPIRPLNPSAPSMFYFKEDSENKIPFYETLPLSEMAELEPTILEQEIRYQGSVLDLEDHDGLSLQDDPTETPSDCYDGLDSLFDDIYLTSPMKQLHLKDNETESPDDYCKGLNFLFSDINLISPIRSLTPSAPSMFGPFYFEEDAENKIPFNETLPQSETAERQPAILDEEVSHQGLVPLSCEHARESYSVPAFCKPELVEERLEEKHENLELEGLSLQDDQTEKPIGDYHGLDLFADMHIISPKNLSTPSATVMTEDLESPYSFEENTENKKSFMQTLQQSDITVMKPALQNSKLMELRGKSASVQLQSSRARENSTNAQYDLGMESQGNNSVRRQSFFYGLHMVADWVEEFACTPDKENSPPATFILNRPSKEIGDEKMKDEWSINSLLSSPDEEGEEVFTPDKENMTQRTHLLRSKNKMGKLHEINRFKMYRSSPLKSSGSTIHEEVCMPESSNISKKVQGKILGNSDSSSLTILEADVAKVREQRKPFQSLFVNSNKMRSDASDLEGTISSCKPVSKMKTTESIHPFNTSSKGESKVWSMVVDTSCLLNKESRKALQLMQGLRGTSLIVPRSVIMELDCMNRQCYLFRRTTEASLASKWISDCMANTKWWVHVQSLEEDARPIALTPRTWPAPQLIDEEKENVSASSFPCSPQGSFLGIASPTIEKGILECALFFRKSLGKRQFVLLSDDVSLKIMAMAEGLLCETAEEFRQSLVNPFSERFLWTDSSPRGHTWSCLDDVVLKEKYYKGHSSKQSRSGEDAKGLKLILLYNSRYRQTSAAS